MTRDVYVVPQTVPKGGGERGGDWYHFDKVNSASALFNREYSHTGRPFFFPPLERKKMQQYLSPSRDIL